MHTELHCNTGDCPHFDAEFKREMIEGLTELRTNMKAIIGNGQPGMIGKLETRIEKFEDTLDDHAAYIDQQKGGGRVLNWFITASVSFAVAIFGSWIKGRA